MFSIFPELVDGILICLPSLKHGNEFGWLFMECLLCFHLMKTVIGSSLFLLYRNCFKMLLLHEKWSCRSRPSRAFRGEHVPGSRSSPFLVHPIFHQLRHDLAASGWPFHLLSDLTLTNLFSDLQKRRVSTSKLAANICLKIGRLLPGTHNLETIGPI